MGYRIDDSSRSNPYAEYGTPPSIPYDYDQTPYGYTDPFSMAYAPSPHYGYAIGASLFDILDPGDLLHQHSGTQTQAAPVDNSRLSSAVATAKATQAASDAQVKQMQQALAQQQAYAAQLRQQISNAQQQSQQAQQQAQQAIQTAQQQATQATMTAQQQAYQAQADAQVAEARRKAAERSANQKVDDQTQIAQLNAALQYANAVAQGTIQPNYNYDPTQDPTAFAAQQDPYSQGSQWGHVPGDDNPGYRGGIQLPSDW